MGLLDFVFGGKRAEASQEDDLEFLSGFARSDNEIIPRTDEELKSLIDRQGLFAPTRTFGARLDNTKLDDAGYPSAVDFFGRPINFEVNPEYNFDQASPTTDDLLATAGDAYEGAKQGVASAVKDPVGTAVNMMEGVTDFGKDVLSGDASMFDIGSLVSGLPIATKALNSAGIIDLPDADGSTTGLFLPVSKIAKDMKGRVGKDVEAEAQALKDGGASRDEIWNQLGVWQINDKAEWLTEIPDDRSAIAGLDRPVNFDSLGETTKTTKVTSSGTNLKQKEVARYEARQALFDVQDRLDAGEIDQQQAEWEAQDIQNKLDKKLGEPESIVETVTETVPAGERPSNKQPKLTKGRPGGSKLDEVLGHAYLYDFLEDAPEGKKVEAENKGDVYTLPTAEANRRTAASAGEKGYYGVNYPDNMINRVSTEATDKSMISSFSNTGFTNTRPFGKKLNTHDGGRNFRDTEIIKAFEKGEITKEQAGLDFIWSTMLHETQHFVDNFFNSQSGTGNNLKASRAAIAQAKSDQRKSEKEFAQFAKSKKFKNKFWSKLNEKQLRSLLGAYQEYSNQIIKALRLDPNNDKAAEAYDYYIAAVSTDIPYYTVEEFFEAATGYKKLNSASNFKEPGLPKGFMGSGKKDYDLIHLSERYREMLRDSENKYLTILKNYEQREPIESQVKYNQELEVYKYEMGEMKARLVQARRNMTQEEREKTAPYNMIDVDESLTYGDGKKQGIMSADPDPPDVIKGGKREYSDRDFDQLNLSDREVEILADAGMQYEKSVGKPVNFDGNANRPQSPDIIKFPEEQGVEGLLQRMGPSIMEDMYTDEVISTAIEDIFNIPDPDYVKRNSGSGYEIPDDARSTFNADALDAVARAGYSPELLQWAINENSIRKTKQKYRVK